MLEEPSRDTLGAVGEWSARETATSSSQSGRGSLEDRRESIEALLDGRTEGKDRQGSNLIAYGEAMRFSQSVASDGSPCKSRSPENGRESLDGRRESIEALLHGRTEGEDRLGLYTIPESGRESLEDSSESIEALEDRRESIEALLDEEEMSSAPRSAYVSSSGDRASPSHDEEERSDGEPPCVLQEADEPDCLAIN